MEQVRCAAAEEFIKMTKLLMHSFWRQTVEKLVWMFRRLLPLICVNRGASKEAEGALRLCACQREGALNGA